MTIRTPTSLVIDFNTDLKTEIANNKFVSHRLLSNSLQLPVGRYSVGSIDISTADNSVSLGHAGVSIMSCDSRINVTLGQSTPITTKLFAYDGIKMPISVSTNSITPITIEYILGDKLPSMSTAPYITSVVPNETSAVVTFTTPTDDGGSEITSYTVTAQPGDITATDTVSPIEITELEYDTEYSFTVVATNAVGDSSVSNVVTATTPAAPTVPTAPTITSVVAGDAQATVTFTPPTDLGSGTFDYYKVIYSPGGSYTTGTSSPIIATELTNGTEYTFTVVAVTSDGEGEPSEPSESVTPVGLPDAPVITNATINLTTATISFTTPNNNGTPITGYTVITLPTNVETSGTASPIQVPNLRGGVSYTFKVVAVTDDGNSAESVQSASLTAVATVPDAPTMISASGADGSATVTFTPPANDGGANISTYQVTSNPDNIVATGYNSPVLITTLTNGTQYTFTVAAVNSAGTGASSAASNSVTPAAA